MSLLRLIPLSLASTFSDLASAAGTRSRMNAFAMRFFDAMGYNIIPAPRRQSSSPKEYRCTGR